MRQIDRVVPGVPFILTVPLLEIQHNLSAPNLVFPNTPSDVFIESRILFWATETFKQRKTTIKTCNHWKTTEFNDGEMKNVLRVEGYMYGGLKGKDVSDMEVEHALKDFERYILTGESVALNPV